MQNYTVHALKILKHSSTRQLQLTWNLIAQSNSSDTDHTVYSLNSRTFIQIQPCISDKLLTDSIVVFNFLSDWNS